MVTREQMVVQSTQDFIKGGLTAKDYGAGVVNVRDAFPTYEERAADLDVSQIAVGFVFDDGGTKIEMGSDLTRRIYTVEFWTFGTTGTVAENVAHVIRAILEGAGSVPLKDLSQAGQPVIDQLLLLDENAVAVTRQMAANPLAWDRYVYTTTAKVEDTYYPSLVG